MHTYTNTYQLIHTCYLCYFLSRVSKKRWKARVSNSALPSTYEPVLLTKNCRATVVLVVVASVEFSAAGDINSHQQ